MSLPNVTSLEISGAALLKATIQITMTVRIKYLVFLGLMIGLCQNFTSRNMVTAYIVVNSTRADPPKKNTTTTTCHNAPV